MSPVFTYPKPIMPTKLQEATRKLRNDFRAAGLIADVAYTSDADMEEWARRLMVEVQEAENRVRLSPDLRQRVSDVIVWMFAQADHESDWDDELEQLRDAVVVHNLILGRKGWWAMLCLYPDDSAVLDAFKATWHGWPPRMQNAMDTYLHRIELSHLSRLSHHLAAIAVREHRLSTVTTELWLGLVGSPLVGDVQDLLASMEAAPWVAHHSIEEIQAYCEDAGVERVAKIARQLLEPLHDAGLKPTDVGPSTDLAKLVRMLSEYLRRSLREPRIREHLGDRAAEVIQWWRTQSELEKFFKRWDAQQGVEQQRIRFWRRMVRHIEDVVEKPAATALAMLIDGYWYVEFGRYGNSCWRYTDHEWKRINRMPVYEEGDLKVHPNGYSLGAGNRYLQHFPGWQGRYPRWIGKWPD